MKLVGNKMLRYSLAVFAYYCDQFVQSESHVTKCFFFEKVEFRYELGSGTATIRSSNPVAMREWNSVIVSRSIFEGELRLNDDRVKKGRSPGEFRALNVDSNLYVGGLPSTLSLPTSLQYLGQDVGFYGKLKTFLH